MSYGPEGEAFFCDVCEDDPKRCDKRSCPGAPPMTHAKDCGINRMQHGYDGDGICDCKPSSPSTLGQDAGPRAPTILSQAELNALGQRLMALTPGGSEYFSRHGDGFKVDLAACVSFLERHHHYRLEQAKLKSRQPHVTLTQLEYKARERLRWDIACGPEPTVRHVFHTMDTIIDRLCLTKAESG